MKITVFQGFVYGFPLRVTAGEHRAFHDVIAVLILLYEKGQFQFPFRHIGSIAPILSLFQGRVFWVTQ